MQMLATVQASEAPALLVQSRVRESARVNHCVWLMYRPVDRLFDNAGPIVAVGPAARTA